MCESRKLYIIIGRVGAFVWAIVGTMEQIMGHFIHKTKLNIYRILVDVRVLRVKTVLFTR